MDFTGLLNRLIIYTGDLPEEAERLLIQGADPNTLYDGDTALISAIKCERGEIVRLLLRREVDVNARNSIGETALHYAVRYGFIRELIEAGADLEAKDCTGMTPLHTASWRNKTESVKLLLQAGADLNALDNQGRTLMQLSRRKEMRDLFNEYASDDIKEPGVD